MQAKQVVHEFMKTRKKEEKFQTTVTLCKAQHQGLCEKMEEIVPGFALLGPSVQIDIVLHLLKECLELDYLTA